jgi:uncharacterized membrane protein YdbT with pleckstrin-like domain
VPDLQPYLAVVLFALLIVPLAFAISTYVRWSSEVYVVTNFRVLQVDGVFSKSVLDSSLEKVNDVVLRQSLFGRMLNYGDIEILTASENAVNRFERISRPIAFKRVMMDAKNGLGEPPRFSSTRQPTFDEDERSEADDQILSSLILLHENGLLDDREFTEKKSHLSRPR